jgi:D-glycero-alpha-D-manno-heptose-7-phosphate kinase
MLAAHHCVRARAPLRLGLAGGGTDLSPYCDLHGGAVLNATIGRFAHASLCLGGEDVVLRARDIEVEERCAPSALTHEGVLGLHRAVYARIQRQFLDGRGPGLTLTTMIDAPPGSGLGSSSALVVAMVEAFRIAFDLPLGQYDVARLAYEIERVDLGLAGGRQDQYAAAFGGVNFIEFLPGERVVVNPLRLRASVLHELEASLVVCFTGQSRTSHKIIVDQIAHIREQDAAALEGMHQLKADAFEMKMALFRGEFDALGDILSRSWRAKKATAASISNPLIERLWDAALAAGAKSGKVSGAGGGGFLMFLCDPERRSEVMRALRAAGGEPDLIAFSADGVTGWCAP